MNNVVTRFAPSPTGHVHIGNIRTALFNWLFAKKNKGKFILRIEDTDKLRSNKIYSEEIIEILNWLGLDFDKIFYQSERISIYQDYAKKLIEKNWAYICKCPLEDKKRDSITQNTMYDRTCRELNLSIPNSSTYTVRFKVPLGEKVKFQDIIHGEIEFDTNEIDDFIILRSDGTPTYNFAVVIDDALMEVSHVIRGDDHITNTPKQILLYQALGFKIPQFAHLPLILGPDKTVLSKRHGSTAVYLYKEQGFLPIALINFLARLGWGHESKEVFTLEELIDSFDLYKVSKTAAIFDISKLEWLNLQHLKLMDNKTILNLVIPFWKHANYNYSKYNENILSRIIELFKPRVKNLKELQENSYYFFTDKIHYNKEIKETFYTNENKDILNKVITLLQQTYNWESKNLEQIFRKLSKELNIKLVNIAQLIRFLITGQTSTPPLFDILEIIGKEDTLNRLKKF